MKNKFFNIILYIITKYVKGMRSIEFTSRIFFSFNSFFFITCLGSFVQEIGTLYTQLGTRYYISHSFFYTQKFNSKTIRLPVLPLLRALCSPASGNAHFQRFTERLRIPVLQLETFGLI